MKKIHRIVVAVKDIDEAATRYEALFGVPFTRTGPVIATMGLRVAAAWDLGIELLQPIAGSDGTLARDIQKFLDERGEGICGAAFSVRDMKRDVAQAEAQKLTAYGPTFGFPPEVLESEFGGKFRRFEETVYDFQGLGYLVALVDADERR